MKLCRFDLVSSPGTARSGIVYGGKVYETDGANPVGVHDWNEARLLSPVGQPPSFRLFASLPKEKGSEAYDFRYLNPSTLVGPHGSIPRSEGLHLGCIPCLCVVVAGGGANVPVADADGLVLGLTLGNVFFQTSDQPMAILPAWALDSGTAIGPALTTPDELDDAASESDEGRRYSLDVSMTLNGDEVFQTNASALEATPAQLLSFCSLTCALRQGDLVAIGLTEPHLDLNLKPGDQVKLISERLGALVTKLG